MAEYDITAQIVNVLQTYTDEVTERVNEEAERCAEGLKKDLRMVSPSRTGAYAKTWQRKVTKRLPCGSKEHTVYNAKNYQLTHLLEYPHAGPYGRGVVPAHPHIAAMEKKWNKEFEESAERVVQKIDE